MLSSSLRVTLASLVAVLPHVAHPQPAMGTLVGPEGHILNYECFPDGSTLGGQPSERVRCDFVQVLLTQNLEPADFEARLSENVDGIMADAEGMAAFCTQVVAPMVEILRFSQGQELVDTPDLMLPSDIIDRAEFLRSFNSDRDYNTSVYMSADAYCGDKTEANARTLASILLTRDTKTCSPMVIRYEQVFVKVSETLWAVESSPEPPCAIVNTSRFIMPEGGLGILWEYVAEKRILNPDAVTSSGIMCGDLDEEAYLYSWRTPTVRVDCEFMD